MDVLEEQLQVLMGHWGDEPFSFDGKHYVLSDLDAQPKPVQQPHPPLLMGGSAGPRSAALAARFADEYNTPFPSLEDVAEFRGRDRGGVRARRPRPDPVLGDDRNRARRRRRRPRGPRSPGRRADRLSARRAAARAAERLGRGDRRRGGRAVRGLSRRRPSPGHVPDARARRPRRGRADRRARSAAGASTWDAPTRPRSADGNGGTLRSPYANTHHQKQERPGSGETTGRICGAH